MAPLHLLHCPRYPIDATEITRARGMAKEAMQIFGYLARTCEMRNKSPLEVSAGSVLRTTVLWINIEMFHTHAMTQYC